MLYESTTTFREPKKWMCKGFDNEVKERKFFCGQVGQVQVFKFKLSLVIQYPQKPRVHTFS